MRLLKKVFMIVPMLLLAAFGAFAQKVTFEVNAPSVVSADEVFRLEFSLNAKPDGFTPPAITGFDVLAGPTTSQGQSISIVNGNMTQSVNFTYTYVLQAHAPGKYTIPSAEVTVDGKSYTTHPYPIEVVNEGNSAPQGGTDGDRNRPAAQPSGKLAADDMVLRVTADRRSVYKGQPILVTAKLYTRVMASLESFKTPAFNGFWSQELNVENQRPRRETLNGKVYDAIVLRQFLLYPQQAGTLHIEQFDMTLIAQIVTQSRRQSIFDDFFNGGPEVQEIRKKLTASPIRIEVKEFPSGAPASFNGAVGKFTMESQLPTGSITANSAANYTVKISGTGNLPLIQAPKLNLPNSFEQYNIKTTESLNSTTAGISGYRQFEYPFIARAEGTYPVEPIEFSYFNPDLARYVTLSSKTAEVIVLPDSTGGSVPSRGMVSGMHKEDIKILGQDIRFIKLGKAQLVSRDRIFMASPLYFVLLLLIAAAFVFSLVWLQKRIRESRNAALVRGKRANKVALQRLRAANGYMKADDRRRFFEEMLRALWGYMSDKLNIPVANLTKENVREELLKRGVSAELSARFIEIISECEYAQYSPAVSGQMNDIYQGAVETISKFESVIKR